MVKFRCTFFHSPRGKSPVAQQKIPETHRKIPVNWPVDKKNIAPSDSTPDLHNNNLAFKIEKSIWFQKIFVFDVILF